MPSIKLRTRARTPISIGSNQSSKSWVLAKASECSATGFVLLLRMAWSPPAWQRRNRLGSTTRRLRHLQFLPTPLRHPAVYGGSTPYLASAVLDHTDPRVTEEHYNRATSMSAAQSYATLIKE